MTCKVVVTDASLPDLCKEEAAARAATAVLKPGATAALAAGPLAGAARRTATSVLMQRGIPKLRWNSYKAVLPMKSPVR